MRSGLFLVLMVSAAGCLKPWDVLGPYQCGKDDSCPGTFVCDDGVCCQPGGKPACPTLPNPGGSCDSNDPRLYYRDQDGDGEGTDKISRIFCAAPTRPDWVTNSTDCDDLDKTINRKSVELCNGKDDNCNQVIDENLTPQQNFYPDDDGDGQGADDAGLSACAAPAGYTAVTGDCARYDPTKFRGAVERCNNLDDDCDGQADQPGGTYADTDTATTNNFPCVIDTAKGLCRNANFRCDTAPGGGVVRVCRSIVVPKPDVCDGLDNDCAGSVDDAPVCGGPPALVGSTASAGIVYRAQRLTSGGALTTSCQALLPGTPATVTNNGTVWTGTSTGYHVWSAEAPAGTTWDLSKAKAQLKLQFAATANATATAGGAWGDPTAGAGFNPVVYLCGERDTDFIRYRILNSGSAFKLNDTSFNQVLPLNNSSPTWIVGIGSGFDTSKVKRIEVLVFTQSSGFTITFDPSTGMGVGP
jgi:hypothetical protein